MDTKLNVHASSCSHSKNFKIMKISFLKHYKRPKSLNSNIFAVITQYLVNKVTIRTNKKKIEMPEGHNKTLVVLNMVKLYLCICLLL